jgi:hypothetical protein
MHVYPTGWSVGQANLNVPWPRQKVLERKRSFYPRLYIPAQGNSEFTNKNGVISEAPEFTSGF